MKTRNTPTMTILTVALLAGGTAFALTSNDHPSTLRAAESEHTLISGIIESVSPDDNAFTVLVEATPDSAAESVTVHVDDETRYTLDGKESTMEDALKTERPVKARIYEDVATQVNVTTRKNVGM